MNPVYMAILGKSESADSGRQTKKRRREALLEIHSERLILSSSASSSGPNMAEAHQWTHDEEIALFREAHTLLTTRKFVHK
ncbi:hypothetical protein BDA96_09G112700 [Sorghum bicolor]|uniref:Uncharacterized protein n=2 Tax=Sorghum bicolor TaxID=4558 RepID=A0A921U485_SORBI|nr:hypothetical protein BDA96_09G112700 [Sorghum bicolor]KXG21786.1 hypothetical protein SORBI_3009G107800 [Sorghum bicolor]